ncbi:membrane protein insertion efficiency factor YidD [Vibrio splendidus]
MRILAILSIKGYQKHLSPRKGFKCAHARYYGGKSCSEAVIEYLEGSPLLALPSDITARFKECKMASLEMNGGKRKRRRNTGNESESDCLFWLTWGMCWPE